MIIGRITATKCDGWLCKKILYNGGMGKEKLSKTELDKDAKAYARENEWIVTRENKFYCPDCAKKMKLRNSNKK